MTPPLPANATMAIPRFSPDSINAPSQRVRQNQRVSFKVPPLTETHQNHTDASTINPPGPMLHRYTLRSKATAKEPQHTANFASHIILNNEEIEHTANFALNCFKHQDKCADDHIYKAVHPVTEELVDYPRLLNSKDAKLWA